MAKNNHLYTDNRKKLDKLLRAEIASDGCDILSKVLDYARLAARIENVLVVVSDMADGKSHIIAGGFAQSLGLTDYHYEDSIWESKILSLMSQQEQEEKYIAELRYLHYLRHLPKGKRSQYYLISKLRFSYADGSIQDVLHRMYYLYGADDETVRYAICVYGPATFEIKGKSHIVNSVTGITEELTDRGNVSILSPRECQVLTLVDLGLKSAEIAERLNISIHTVNRHRQEIIGKLQVKNSHEACRIAKSMRLI